MILVEDGERWIVLGIILKGELFYFVDGLMWGNKVN